MSFPIVEVGGRKGPVLDCAVDRAKGKREDCQVGVPSGSSVRRNRRRGVGGGVLGVNSGGVGEGGEVEEGTDEGAGERVGAEGVVGGIGDRVRDEGEA